jgi:hypothetical protein
MEAFLHEHIQRCDGCLLHHVSISMLLFVNDLILLASTPTGLQRQLNSLTLMINLGKTKVMIFNFSKKLLLVFHFYFLGGVVEVTTAYTYMGVQFLGPRFKLRHANQPRVLKLKMRIVTSPGGTLHFSSGYTTVSPRRCK